MNFERFSEDNTTRNCQFLQQKIAAPDTRKIVLYASSGEEIGAYSRSDGPATNLPLMAALVETVDTNNVSTFVVCDGPFLTAQRKPRFTEINDVLDAAVQSGKVSVAMQRVPFTSSLSPKQAVEALWQIYDLHLLTDKTRPVFFSLLSELTEKEIQAI